MNGMHTTSYSILNKCSRLYLDPYQKNSEVKIVKQLNPETLEKNKDLLNKNKKIKFYSDICKIRISKNTKKLMNQYLDIK